MDTEIVGFIDQFRNAVDFQNPADINTNTQLATLPEWDSLAALGVIVMFDMEYGVTITGEDIKKAQTVQNLYELIAARRSN